MMYFVRNLAFWTFIGCLTPLLYGIGTILRWRGKDAGPFIVWFLGTAMRAASRLGGLKYRLVNFDKLPDGPILIAALQQSTWENMAFPVLFSNPTIFVKPALDSVPVAGFITNNNNYVKVTRDGNSPNNQKAFEEAKRQFDNGRSVLIFPEGTRDSVAGDTRLKAGVYHIYQALDCACIPVAVNSGRFWPYGHFFMGSGTITVEVLNAIPAGLSRTDFMEALKTQLDEAAIRLNRAASAL